MGDSYLDIYYLLYLDQLNNVQDHLNRKQIHLMIIYLDFLSRFLHISKLDVDILFPFYFPIYMKI